MLCCATLKPTANISTMISEFRDVVFEDVAFDNNSFVTRLDIVFDCNIYLEPIIIKHRILKHHILELPKYINYNANTGVSHFLRHTDSFGRRRQ